MDSDLTVTVNSTFFALTKYLVKINSVLVTKASLRSVHVSHRHDFVNTATNIVTICDGPLLCHNFPSQIDRLFVVFHPVKIINVTCIVDALTTS